MLVGRPVDPGDGPASFSVAGTRPLDRLEPVMAQLVAAQGPSEFSLLEEIQLSSILQDQAGSSGKVAKVSQTVTLAGEQVVARVNITLPPDHLFRRQVSLLPGQYLVVGQMGFDARGILGFVGQFEVSPPGTVGSRRHRALQRFRGTLSEARTRHD